jgi:hypothetical protein
MKLNRICHDSVTIDMFQFQSVYVSVLVCFAKVRFASTDRFPFRLHGPFSPPRTFSPRALYDTHEATRHHVHSFFVCVMSIGTCYNHSILSCQNTKLDDTQDNACDHSIDGGCRTDDGPLLSWHRTFTPFFFHFLIGPHTS